MKYRWLVVIGTFLFPQFAFAALSTEAECREQVEKLDQRGAKALGGDVIDCTDESGRDNFVVAARCSEDWPIGDERISAFDKLVMCRDKGNKVDGFLIAPQSKQDFKDCLSGIESVNGQKGTVSSMDDRSIASSCFDADLRMDFKEKAGKCLPKYRDLGRFPTELIVKDCGNQEFRAKQDEVFACIGKANSMIPERVRIPSEFKESLGLQSYQELSRDGLEGHNGLILSGCKGSDFSAKLMAGDEKFDRCFKGLFELEQNVDVFPSVAKRRIERLAAKSTQPTFPEQARQNIYQKTRDELVDARIEYNFDTCSTRDLYMDCIEKNKDRTVAEARLSCSGLDSDLASRLQPQSDLNSVPGGAILKREVRRDMRRPGGGNDKRGTQRAGE